MGSWSKSREAHRTRRAVEHEQYGARCQRVGRTDRRISLAATGCSRWTSRTFAGYRRSDGQVGTRNHWLVVPLVFCENRNIGVLKRAFEDELGFAAPQVYNRQVAELARLYREGLSAETIQARVSKANGSGESSNRVFQNIDGIKFLLHEGGCGGTRKTQTTFAD